MFTRKSKTHQLLQGYPPPAWVVKLVGQKVVRLQIVSYAGFTSMMPRGRRFYLNVICDCGNEKQVSASNVKNGDIKSCGCLHREISKRVNTKHNHANFSLNGVTPTYHSWSGAKSRCLSESDQKYYCYGARGIKICSRWMDFRNFLADMGERPAGKTIDRKNNNGHYSCGHCDECVRNNWPANCRWGTPLQQGGNQSTTKLILLSGELVSMSEAERRLGFGSDVIGNRLRTGWTLQEALATPARKRALV